MLPPGVYLHRLVDRFTGRAHEISEPTNWPARPTAGPLVWCHVSGRAEMRALLGFLHHLLLQRDDLNFLVTHRGDADVNEITEELENQVQFYAMPVGSPKLAGPFLDHWRPDLLLWMDNWLDSSMLSESHRRHIPALWINARSPLTAQPSLRWVPGAARALVSGFDTILAENEICVAELSRLGLPSGKLQVAGAMQEQSHPPSCNLAERDDIARQLGARPIWLALCSAPDEEQTLLSAHRQLMRKSHRLLLVMVPDDPARGLALAQMLEDEGWIVALRSEEQEPTSEVQIYIADLLEEEGLWMHLSPITLMGRTLTGGPCHTPNDPAALGSVVLFGPRLDQHIAAFSRLEAAGAARKVRDAATLVLEVEHLLQPENAAKMAIAAWDITTSGAELSTLVEGLVIDMLDKRGV